MPADRKRKAWYKKNALANKKHARFDNDNHSQSAPLNQLDVGIAGLMFTFAGKFSGDNTRFAIKEAYKLLETYVDVLKPEFNVTPAVDTAESSSTNKDATTDNNTGDTKETPENSESNDKRQPAKTESSSDSGEESEEEEDIADSLKKEVEGMTESGIQRARGPFTKLRCKVHNVLMMNDGQLVDLLGFCGRILDDMHTKKQQAAFQCRHLQRILPFQTVCNSRPEAFQKCMESLLPKYFGKRDPPPSYAVFYKTRCQDLLARSDVINAVTEVVQAVSPLSRVNLNSPDLAVVVESIAGRTCIGVMPDYMKYKRYTMRPDAASEQQAAVQAKAAKKEALENQGANGGDKRQFGANKRYVWKKDDDEEEQKSSNEVKEKSAVVKDSGDLTKTAEVDEVKS